MFTDIVWEKNEGVHPDVPSVLDVLVLA